MKIQSTRKCRKHHVTHFVNVPNSKAQAATRGVAAWRAGALIQDALPMLDASQREILLTGTCQEAWDEL